MQQKSSIPPIPALPITEAHSLEVIERKLSSALENCMDRYGAIANELKTDTYMRSYVVKIFSLYLSAYSKHSTVLKHWIPELKLNSIQWAMGCLLDFSGVTEKESKRYEKLLVATLDEYVASTYGNSLNPLLAALAEPQPDAKLASAYAASGIDIASGSPLLKMIMTSARGALPQSPRLSSQISSPSAARKMEAFMENKGLNQTEFAIQASTSDKTIRKFRQTGKVKRSILTGIASAMGITKEELLKP